MDNNDGAVNGSESGKLVLYSIPSKETEEMVVSYLSRIVKNVPAEKLARQVRITPFVLTKNITAKRGERIARNLRDLGAKADFVPHDHDPEAHGLKRPPETALTPEFESIQMMSEQHKSQQHKRSRSSRFGKRLATAIVVVILIAVFSMLTWQLYLLLTKNLFN